MFDRSARTGHVIGIEDNFLTEDQCENLIRIFKFENLDQ